MLDSKKKQAMNMTTEIHHRQPFSCYTLEDGIFSMYFYITVYSRPINFSLLTIFLQWYKCLTSLQAIIGGGSDLN